MMIRKILTALAFCTTIALTGCSASDKTAEQSGQESSPPSDPETTVTINGKQWTCEQITASTPQQCGERTQQAFDKYKGNIDQYVNSGKLGPLNDAQQFTYEDAAFAGLVACVYAESSDGQNEYINFMMETPPFDTRMTERVMYLPAWFEAPKSLCTDLNTGHQSKDLITP
jgi:hypothetical protein